MKRGTGIKKEITFADLDPNSGYAQGEDEMNIFVIIALHLIMAVVFGIGFGAIKLLILIVELLKSI